MDKGILSDREKAMEANYFRQQDAKLLESLRKASKLDEVAKALGEGLHVDNPELLERVRALGITAETAAAFLSAPLVQVAWAEGSVTKKEQEAVLRIAHGRGVTEGSPAEAKLTEWLQERPSDALFDAAAEKIGESEFVPIDSVLAGGSDHLRGDVRHAAWIVDHQQRAGSGVEIQACHVAINRARASGRR